MIVTRGRARGDERGSDDCYATGGSDDECAARSDDCCAGTTGFDCRAKAAGPEMHGEESIAGSDDSCAVQATDSKSEGQRKLSRVSAGETDGALLHSGENVTLRACCCCCSRCCCSRSAGAAAQAEAALKCETAGAGKRRRWWQWNQLARMLPAN